MVYHADQVRTNHPVLLFISNLPGVAGKVDAWIPRHHLLDLNIHVVAKIAVSNLISQIKLLTCDLSRDQSSPEAGRSITSGVLKYVPYTTFIAAAKHRRCLQVLLDALV